jgi:hypothetical protein
MVAERNIANGLLSALRALDTSEAGRRGIVIVTSGDSSMNRAWVRELAETAAHRRIGIHVICLGPKADYPTGGPRINTKYNLGYGGFRVVETAHQLLAALRASFDGLTPAFGMRGTNRAVILLDCSETMVESYGNTTRIEMVMASLQEFLGAPLIRNYPFQPMTSNRYYDKLLPRSAPSVGRATSAFAAPGTRQWTPGRPDWQTSETAEDSTESPQNHHRRAH